MSSTHDVSDEKFQRAVERFRVLAGAEGVASESLVEAAMRGAIDQALETITGSGPVPTSLTSARAEYLQFVCLAANRILDQRETEVLLRSTATAARSVLTNMRATYEEALRDQFLERMRDDVQVRPSGSDETGLGWRLTFTESDTYDLARGELLKAGLAGAMLEEIPTRHVLEVRRDWQKAQPLLVLGIEEPASA